MPNDYFSGSFQGQRDWFANYHAQIALQGATLGLTAAEITEHQSYIAPFQAKVEAVLDAERALEAATGEYEDFLASAGGMPEMRRRVHNLKTLAGYNSGVGHALKIVVTGGGVEPATIKPRLRVVTEAGRLRLAIVKGGAETVNLYVRRKGEGAWRLLVPKRVQRTYDDTTPLAVAGVPEEREYRALAVRGDDEVGEPSDIVSAICAG